MGSQALELLRVEGCSLIEGSEPHRYVTPIGEVPSVNTIISHVETGGVRQPFTTNQLKAMSRGTRFHTLIEKYLSTEQSARALPELESIEEELQPYWMSACMSYGMMGDAHAIECALYHPDGWAGTTDHVVKWKGKRTMVEPTTTASTYYNPDWALQRKAPQVAAYRIAWNHHFPKYPIEEVCIIVALSSGQNCMELWLDKEQLAIAESQWESYWSRYQEMLERSSDPTYDETPF